MIYGERFWRQENVLDVTLVCTLVFSSLAQFSCRLCANLGVLGTFGHSAQSVMVSRSENHPPFWHLCGSYSPSEQLLAGLLLCLFARWRETYKQSMFRKCAVNPADGIWFGGSLGCIVSVWVCLRIPQMTQIKGSRSRTHLKNENGFRTPSIKQQRCVESIMSPQWVTCGCCAIDGKCDLWRLSELMCAAGENVVNVDSNASAVWINYILF